MIPRYDGDWVNDVKCGRGVYYFLDNERYEGQFHDDQFHGKGTAYFFDGTKFVGIWENGIVKEKDTELSAEQEAELKAKQEEEEKIVKEKELQTKKEEIKKAKLQSKVIIINREETVYKRERPVARPIESRLNTSIKKDDKIVKKKS